MRQRLHRSQGGRHTQQLRRGHPHAEQEGDVKMASKAKVEQQLEHLATHYAAAMKELNEAYQWAVDGFPGATPEDLARIAKDFKPEQQAERIRRRAERNVKAMLRDPAILRRLMR